MIKMDYYKKVKKFNKRKDYQKDVETARFFLEYCFSHFHSKKIYMIGTGLGGDLEIIKKTKGLNIIGIEPRSNFYKQASNRYKKFHGKLLKIDLGQFVKTHSNLSGIFVFMHSFNHIPTTELKLFSKIIKNSYIIIINPNPTIEKLTGKTDDTVISYLDSKKIQKILNSTILFDFFYNPVKIKRKDIFLREAILLKRN